MTLSLQELLFYRRKVASYCFLSENFPLSPLMYLATRLPFRETALTGLKGVYSLANLSPATHSQASYLNFLFLTIFRGRHF